MRGRRSAKREVGDDLNPEPVPSDMPSRWSEPLQRARHALIEWLSHLLVVAGLLLGFHGIEILLHTLGADDRLLFGQIPLKRGFQKSVGL